MPDSPTPKSGLVTLDPARVKPFADQPRKRFFGIAQLAASIRAVGQVTPIVVSCCAEPGYDAELVDGERRLRACLTGGMPVQAVFETAADGERFCERFARSVAGNFCRQAHDPPEIMEAIAVLKQTGKTGREIAAICGKTTSWVAQYGQLSKCAPEILDQLKAPAEGTTKRQRRVPGRITFAMALALSPLPHAMQLQAAAEIRKKRMGLNEARTYLARFGDRRKLRIGRETAPHQQFRAVSSAIAQCSHVVGRYLDIPGVEIGPMIRNAAPDERKRVADLCESLCASLLAFGDALVK